MGVTQFLIQVIGETSFLYRGETVGAEICFVIDVGDGTHAWTEDDFDVIREVELKPERKQI